MRITGGFIFVVIFTFIFTIFILNIMAPVINNALLPWHEFKTEVKSEYDIVDKTMDANNAIYNYEWFKNQENKILALERQIDISVRQRTEFLALYPQSASWSQYQQGEYSRLSANIAGQEQLYEKVVADYNAHSEMANRAIFKDGLPLHVEKKLWI